MNVATPQKTLHELAHQLQVELRATACVANIAALSIQCAMKQGALLVLMQYPPTFEFGDPQELFAVMERLILAIAPQFVSSSLDLDKPYCTKVRLYLKSEAQPRPIAAHTFAYGPSVAGSTVDSDDSETAALGVPEIDPAGRGKSLSEDADPNPRPTDNEPTFDSAIALFNLEEEEPEPELEEADSNWPAFLQGRSLWVLTALGVSAVSFGAGMLLITFPCVFGRCEPIQMATELSRKSSRSLEKAESNRDLIALKQQFKETDRLLSKVPPWSAQSTQARGIQQSNQIRKLEVEKLLKAETKASEAQQKGQVVPQPVASWQQVRSLWEAAIAEVEVIPASSPSYELAQKRLTNYRDGLAIAKRLLEEEQTAQTHIKSAKGAAQKAEARQGLAQTLDQWRAVQVTWQVGVNKLLQVSNTTTAYSEAQTLLASYNAKLAEARDRVTREETAQTAYAQANQLAQVAQSAEAQNQWSLAVINWRKALSSAQQVPQGMPQYEAAQALVAPYTQALANAEKQLKSAIKLQQAQSDIARVCEGTPKTCSFLVTQSVIRVQFTPTYEQAMRNAFAAGQTGNQGAVGGALNHIDGLRTALQAIANNSGIPVEAVNAEGTEIVWGFNPGG
ncbi:MAG TPA: hypothetical protein IGS53_12085 [Leptolyngbyaceae cyanobacterium M33_DOE_097]|uniref:Uncharacterized protein n=1 Tax=Oscillatoriales cyanobacterium SpSt-418 TaxID=2282169 RepID=A0A7C3PGH5_9CYAN|nr:hypothetical protein [Leptolyngbyaceae cyanobacterium M33_DOE_097]